MKKEINMFNYFTPKFGVYYNYSYICVSKIKQVKQLKIKIMNNVFERIKNAARNNNFASVEELKNVIINSTSETIFEITESTYDLDSYFADLMQDGDEVKCNPIGTLEVELGESDASVIVYENYIDSGSDDYVYSFSCLY